MVNIKVTSSTKLSIEKTFETLSNYQNYSDWWVIPVKTKKGVTDYFEFTPVPLITIGIRIKASKEKSEIEFGYVKGPFRGIGKWMLKQLKDEKVQISYEIFLEPTNRLYEHVTKSRLFVNKHKKDINDIIDLLLRNKHLVE